MALRAFAPWLLIELNSEGAKTPSQAWKHLKSRNESLPLVVPLRVFAPWLFLMIFRTATAPSKAATSLEG